MKRAVLDYSGRKIKDGINTITSWLINKNLSSILVEKKVFVPLFIPQIINACKPMTYKRNCGRYWIRTNDFFLVREAL